MRLRSAVILVLATGVASSARTQENAGAGSLRGRVVDGVTHLPIVGANIEISHIELRQLSDSGGRFVFASLPSGPHVLEARHLGYRAGRESLSVSKDDSVEHLILLHQLPVELGEVVISGRQVTFPRFFE